MGEIDIRITAAQKTDIFERADKSREAGRRNAYVKLSDIVVKDDRGYYITSTALDKIPVGATAALMRIVGDW